MGKMVPYPPPKPKDYRKARDRAMGGMRPNWLLNLLWRIPTPVWNWIFRRTGYLFSRKETGPDDGRPQPIVYYFQREAPWHQR